MLCGTPALSWISIWLVINVQNAPARGKPQIALIILVGNILSSKWDSFVMWSKKRVFSICSPVRGKKEGRWQHSMGGSGKMGGDKKVGKKAAAYSPASSRLPTPASFISIDIPAGVIGKKATCLHFCQLTFPLYHLSIWCILNGIWSADVVWGWSQMWWSCNLFILVVAVASIGGRNFTTSLSSATNEKLQETSTGWFLTLPRTHQFASQNPSSKHTNIENQAFFVLFCCQEQCMRK